VLGLAETSCRPSHALYVATSLINGFEPVSAKTHVSAAPVSRTACRQEMNERVPRSEPAEIRGAYVEQCMKDRGFPD
jgi:hypothetical protein